MLRSAAAAVMPSCGRQAVSHAANLEASRLLDSAEVVDGGTEHALRRPAAGGRQASAYRGIANGGGGGGAVDSDVWDGKCGPTDRAT